MKILRSFGIKCTKCSGTSFETLDTRVKRKGFFFKQRTMACTCCGKMFWRDDELFNRRLATVVDD